MARLNGSGDSNYWNAMEKSMNGDAILMQSLRHYGVNPITRKRLWRIFLALLAIFMGFTSLDARAEQPTEDQVRAAFIYNFAKYVEWPESALRDEDKSIVIGVLTEDDFDTVLSESIWGKTLKGKKVLVKHFDTAEDAVAHCHILYIDSSASGYMPAILDALGKAPILTISNVDRFTAKGGMIGFVREGANIRFEINEHAAERVGLKISSQLLKLARTVR
ncbi:MAG: YfiR family protein [Smithellaceae bacterium]|nr:YfiR family protein [Smithellaceae bacterium]